MFFGLREWKVRRKLGDDGLTITINPLLIKYETRMWPFQRHRLQIYRNEFLPTFSKHVILRLMWKNSSFVINDADIERVPIRDSAVYHKMKDVFDHRNDLTRSRTYQTIVERIHSHGQFSHKGYTIWKPEDAPALIESCYLDILCSMEKSGYIDNKISGFGTSGLGNAIIDHDGSLLKCLGASHRFSAALIVGMKGGFPLRINGVHQRWAASNDIYGSSDIGRLAKAIKLVEKAYSPCT